MDYYYYGGWFLLNIVLFFLILQKYPLVFERDSFTLVIGFFLTFFFGIFGIACFWCYVDSANRELSRVEPTQAIPKDIP